MLKVKVLAGVVASTLMIAGISIIPFHKKEFENSFNNVQAYISSSKIAMTEANNKIGDLNGAISTNKKTISGLNDNIESDKGTIDSQKKTIADLEDQLSKKTDSTDGYLTPIEKYQLSKALYSTPIEADPYMYSYYTQVYYTQVATYWANYWFKIYNNPPKNASKSFIKGAQGMYKRFNKAASSSQGSIGGIIGYIYNDNELKPSHVQLPKSEIEAIQNVKLPEKYEKLYNKVVNKTQESVDAPVPKIYSTGYQIGIYRAYILAELASKTYWSYLLENPPKEWTTADINKVKRFISYYNGQIAKNENLMVSVSRF
ncbi:hypothetical protein [uncultured Clostridium sp.]|jgi:uncharacterized coiled-coil protein SlyX|uniref:hypothetical protein n=1 Tax=uncultured Clostridium sp. TaxID=59620 RepID=UPI002617B0FD|nr:hypothetical protein [uncultured Clostridium sp.]